MRKDQMEMGKGLIIIAVIIAIISVLGGVTYIMTSPKAQFEINDFEIYRPSETMGENTKIFFTLSNIGDKPGTFDAELKVDGQILKDRSIKLAENENKEINFSIKVDEVGEHSAKIGDLSENFRIEPPEFEVNDLTITPKEVTPRETVTINVGLKNTGDLLGDYAAELKVDGSIEERKSVTLSAGENKTVSFELRKEEPNSHTVSIEGLSKTFEVLSPAEFKVDNLSVSPGRIRPGENVTVTANIKNVGDLSGDHIVKLKVNGKLEDNKSIHLEGHQSIPLDFVVSKQKERTYRVRVGGAVGFFEVYISSGGCSVCG